MKYHLKYLVLSFFNFVRNPNEPDYKELSMRQKLLDVGMYYLFFSLVICLCVGMLIVILEDLQIINPLEHVLKDTSLLKRALGAILFAPILEEFLFRFPLGSLRRLSWFRWLYYFSVIFFGWIHFFNFKIDNSIYLFLPLITLPQTLLGFLLGYIRILYGFWFAVMLHLLFNSICIWLGLIFD